jgi:glycosyltransferase involved in cell wall biosynthesis
VRALALLGPVDLAYVPFEGDDPSREYAAIDGLECHPIRPSRGVRRLGRYVATCAHGVPHSVARGVSSELVEESARLAEQPGRGRVIADGLTAAAALLPLAAKRPVIYNAHNAGPDYHAPAKESTPWKRLVFSAFERRVLSSAAESWMVSRRDMQIARELAPQSKLRYVPNAVDVNKIVPVAGAERARQRLLMVGDFTYLPNRSGRAFLVDEVMPRVWSELPEVRLTLVGRGLDGWVSPDERIEVAGFVGDLSEVYGESDCVVVPLKSGGGSPLKFVEALAYQVPVVATPLAARGLEVIANKHYLQGEDAPSFSAAIVEVMRRGAPVLAAEGRKLAEAEYSVRALAERLSDPLNFSS